MPFNRFARILQESPQTGELQPNVFLRWPLLKAYLDYLKVTCSRFLHARALPTIFERPCCIFFLGLPIHLPTFQIHLYTWGLFKEANSLQKHRIFWMETTIILSGVCSVIIYCNLFWNRSYHTVLRPVQPEICTSDVVVFQGISSYVMYEFISWTAEFIFLIFLFLTQRKFYKVIFTTCCYCYWHLLLFHESCVWRQQDK